MTLQASQSKLSYDGISIYSWYSSCLLGRKSSRGEYTVEHRREKETWESSVNNPAIMLVWRVRKSQSKPGWSGAEEIIYRKWSSKLFKSMRGDSNISKKNRLISVETARHCRALFLLPNRKPKVSESVWKDQYNRTMILVVIGFEQSFFTRAHSQCEHCSESSFRRRSEIISTKLRLYMLSFKFAPLPQQSYGCHWWQTIRQIALSN